MSKASDFKYKWHDDDRPLGPPHLRFPDMHPEDDWPKNEVFLEIPTAGIAGVWLSTLAALFIYVSMLCFLTDIVTWNFLMVKTPVVWAMAGIGGGASCSPFWPAPPCRTA
jgi:hypothetical protein